MRSEGTSASAEGATRRYQRERRRRDQKVSAPSAEGATRRYRAPSAEGATRRYQRSASAEGATRRYQRERRRRDQKVPHSGAAGCIRIFRIQGLRLAVSALDPLQKNSQPRRGGRYPHRCFYRPSGPAIYFFAIQGLRARFARPCPWLPSGRAFGARRWYLFTVPSALSTVTQNFLP